MFPNFYCNHFYLSNIYFMAKECTLKPLVFDIASALEHASSMLKSDNKDNNPQAFQLASNAIN